MPWFGVEKRNIVRVEPPLSNLSGSAHADMYFTCVSSKDSGETLQSRLQS